jgi:acyl-CoA reductase-like NAD-dependent aldehyde dehydrogenase
MLRDAYPYYLGNRPQQPNRDLEVRDKYSGEVATRTALADAATVDEAIGLAAEAAEPMRRLHAYQRRDVLEHCVRRLEERAEELAQTLCIEAGKPIVHSRGEVSRLIDTFRVAAGEATRITGEVLPMDIGPRAAGYSGMWKRVPVGPCSFITPWNFPLNLVAHKVAPALAAGCPFVLKPASATPVGALVIGEVLAETDLPPGAFSILPCRTEDAEALTTDERLKLLSFTGSHAVGWDLKAKAGKKRVILELGGNAACIVDETADLDDAVERVVFGAFYQSGQSCISIQRLIVQDEVYREFRDKLCAAALDLKLGDPEQEDTFLGPIISEDEAKRIESWIESAREAGATVLCGGRRDGAMMEATVLEGVPRTEKLYREEVFGPVVILMRFDSFDEALRLANDSRYGINAGVFTRDIYRAQRAWDELEVGSVIVGDVPSWRVDHMPYGGVKDSGLGREGIRFTLEEMTEIRLFVLRTP